MEHHRIRIGDDDGCFLDVISQPLVNGIGYGSCRVFLPQNREQQIYRVPHEGFGFLNAVVDLLWGHLLLPFVLLLASHFFSAVRALDSSLIRKWRAFGFLAQFFESTTLVIAIPATS